MVFGADKLPEIARELGKGMRQIKNATNDIKREIQNSADKNDLDIDVVAKIRNEVNRVKGNFDDFSNPIKKVQNDLEKSINPLKDADGNLVSYFTKPKDAKNAVTDISANITADSSTTAVENKDVTEATSTEEVKDPKEEENGSVKRDR